MAEVYKLLVVCLQLDFLPLTTAFSAPKLSQHSVHLTVHFSSLYFMSLIMRMLWEAMLQVLYKSGQKTSAAFPSWAEPVISLHGGQALQILAACSWSPSCPLCVRKQFPGEVSPLLFQGLSKGYFICHSLYPLWPFWRQEWHQLSCNPWEFLLIFTTFQT